MKTYVATIEVEFTCVDPEIFRDRILGIPFGDHDCGFRILHIEERSIPEDEDETLKSTYRTLHGLT